MYSIANLEEHYNPIDGESVVVVDDNTGAAVFIEYDADAISKLGEHIDLITQLGSWNDVEGEFADDADYLTFDLNEDWKMDVSVGHGSDSGIDYGWVVGCEVTVFPVHPKHYNEQYQIISASAPVEDQGDDFDDCKQAAWDAMITFLVEM